MNDSSSISFERWPGAVWDISGAFIFDQDILALHEFLTSYLGMQNPIHYVHGSPCITWNSGRVTREIYPPDFYKNAIQAYTKYKMSVLLTASNTLLTEQHLDDYAANQYCTMLHNASNQTQHGIITCSDLLNDYVKKNYPKLQRISSILKITTEQGKGKRDVYLRYLDEYDMVMLHPDDVYNTELLASLPHPERFIALINEYCIRQCPIRHLHYEDLSQNSLNFLGHDSSRFIQKQEKNGCSNIYNVLLSAKHKTLAQSNEEITRLFEMGFKHFKVQGRGMGNVAAYLTDLLRLMLRRDAEDESITNDIVQRFWMSYLPTVNATL